MGDIRCVTKADLGRLGGEPVLVDVREPGEYDAERLPGSVNVPLSRLAADAAKLPTGRPLVVLCRSGRRSTDAAEKLAALGFRDVYVLEGGLLACGDAVERGPGGAWAMERQVRMAAGTLVLLGAALGSFVHPAGWCLSAAIGAGLVFSAVTDTCGMAAVLAWMPWNRGCGARCGKGG
ncbi:MAG: rhodanese-like domain-containing protein [Elusimicrobia bacterium]|nr:rhodanese-like domain-containing protein [Elusimicrobiota bacterium]